MELLIEFRYWIEGAFAVAIVVLFIVGIRRENKEKAEAAELKKLSEKYKMERLATISETEEHDFVELFDDKIVGCKPCGDTITKIRLLIENKTAKRLNVVIEIGTTFISVDNCQSMIATKQKRFVLRPDAIGGLDVAVACLDAEKPIPSSANYFQFIVSPFQNAALLPFLEAAQGEGPMVIQAGIWAIKGGFTGKWIQDHLNKLGDEGAQESAISERDIDRAKHILNKVDIRHSL